MGNVINMVERAFAMHADAVLAVLKEPDKVSRDIDAIDNAARAYYRPIIQTDIDLRVRRRPLVDIRMHVDQLIVWHGLVEDLVDMRVDAFITYQLTIQCAGHVLISAEISKIPTKPNKVEVYEEGTRPPKVIKLGI